MRVLLFSEENTVEIVENGGGVSTRHKNPGPGAYTTVSLEGGVINTGLGVGFETWNEAQCTRESALFCDLKAWYEKIVN